MKKENSSTRKTRSGAGKTAKKSDDPFAQPPHPLGFNYMTERRPIRASSFSSILPSVVAKYGLGRKLGVERFLKAWREALRRVFADDAFDYDEFSDSLPSRYETFAQCARPTSFRGGALRIEVASNLLYHELQFHAADLLREIQAELPDENVKELRIVAR